MKTCLHLFAFGVGALIVLGHTEMTHAKPASSRAAQDEPEPPISLASAATATLTPSAIAQIANEFGASLPSAQSVNQLWVNAANPGNTAKPIPTSQATISQATSAPAQTTPFPPAGTSTPPSSPTTPTQPSPAPSPATVTPTPQPGSAPSSAPSTPPAKSVPVPEQLNPSANPLSFPTRPSEVQLRDTRQISLQQAIELAERNNRDIEISRLEVERSQATLREARSSFLPTLSFGARLSRSGSNVGGSSSSFSSLGSSGTGLSTGSTVGGTGLGSIVTTPQTQTSPLSGQTTGNTTGNATGTTSGNTTGTTSGNTTGNTTGTTTNNTGTTTGGTTTGTTTGATGPTSSLTSASRVAAQTVDGGDTSGTVQQPQTSTGVTSPTTVTDFSNLGSTSSVRTALSGSLQLSYDLYTSGLRNANLRAAERQVRATELALERTREQLRLDVSGDYYDLQDADEQVRINQAAVANAQANVNDALAQERAGLGTRFDVLRAQVNLANAQQQLTNAQAAQVIRRRQLSQRLSLPEYANVTAADPVEVAGSWALPLEDSIVLAYRNRSELEEQLVQRDISEQQRRAVLSANGPTLSASADYGFSQGFGSDASTGDNYAFALQARWNLFDGGATIARARQREKDKEIAESRFAQNRNTIRFQVEQSYANLQANLVNIATTEQAVTQALEALRLAVLRLQAGVGTQTERINAETDLTRARGNRVSAIIGYNRSLAQLRRAVSNLAQ
ncbi:MAG: TolC family protein [Myxacorys californica WJT36-NPBG1]|nr:TolC family protein [Myxacorys californica WJT36-NPBG1]